MSVYFKIAKPELLQAEIITNIPVPSFKIPDVGVSLENLEINSNPHKYLIIVSQDCDLYSDYKAREAKKITHDVLDQVLLCAAIPYGEFRKIEDGNIYREWANQKRSDQIQEHKIERFHLLPEIAATDDLQGIGIAEKMIADFKDIISIETEYLYYLLRGNFGAHRRTVLIPPYKEHFLQRFYRWHSRVALP